MNASTERVARGARGPAPWAQMAAHGLIAAATHGPHHHPETGRCAVCRGPGQPRVTCQEVGRIWDFFHRKKLHDRKWVARPGAVVCKDCCIGSLAGHRCDWWDLCWNI